MKLPGNKFYICLYAAVFITLTACRRDEGKSPEGYRENVISETPGHEENSKVCMPSANNEIIKEEEPHKEERQAEEERAITEKTYLTEDYGTVKKSSKEFEYKDGSRFNYDIEEFLFKDQYVFINDTLRQFYNTYRNTYNTYGNSLVSTAYEDAEGNIKTDCTPFKSLVFNGIRYVGENYISIQFNDVDYAGGAHPYSCFVMLNVDAKTGKQVSLDGILNMTDEEIFLEVQADNGLEHPVDWVNFDFYLADKAVVFVYRYNVFVNNIVWFKSYNE